MIGDKKKFQSKKNFESKQMFGLRTVRLKRLLSQKNESLEIFWSKKLLHQQNYQSKENESINFENKEIFTHNLFAKIKE